MKVFFEGTRKTYSLDTQFVPKIGEKVSIDGYKYLVIDVTHTLPDSYQTHKICVEVEEIK